MGENRNHYLPTMDGWRAIAVAGVILAHATDVLFFPQGEFANELAHRVTRLGAHGVEIFFSLSGFLITTRLLEEKTRTGTVNLAQFYLRRSFRILPVVFVFLFCLGLLSSLDILSLTKLDWMSSFLFFRNYIPAEHGSWYTAHFWSLAVEEHFYFFWPIFFLWSGGVPKRVFLLGLVLTIWRVIEFRMNVLSRLGLEVAFSGRSDVRMDSLVWGCWFAVLWNQINFKDLSQRYLRPFTTFILLVLLVCFFWFEVPMRLLWVNLIIPVIFIGTISWPKSVLSKILETAFLRWMGRLSFSLYVWNTVFLIGSAAIPFNVSSDYRFIQQLPWNIGALVFISVLSYYFIEKPLISFAAKRFRGGMPYAPFR